MSADPVPVERKFGYQHMMEMQEIEDELREKGLDGIALTFAASAEYLKRHRNDPSFRMKQQQNAFRTQQKVAELTTFTAEELKLIAERFAMSNTDIGQSIHKKAENGAILRKKG